MIYRSFSILIIAVAILMAGMTAAGPARAGETAGSSSVLASATRTFAGLLAVKEADGVFLVRSETGEKKRFTCNPNTTITRNGQPAAYRDLRSRDYIHVEYDSNFVVTVIQANGS